MPEGSEIEEGLAEKHLKDISDLEGGKTTARNIPPSPLQEGGTGHITPSARGNRTHPLVSLSKGGPAALVVAIT